MTLFEASVVHWFVFGSHSSAALAASAGLMSTNPPPVVPPVTSTVPSGRMVEFVWRRANCIEPALVHWGDGWLRSIFSAVAVGADERASGVWAQVALPPPPAYRILPGSYITAVP